MNKEKSTNSSKNHLREIDEGVDKLTVVTIINTIATIITGVAATAIAILQYYK